MDLVTGPLGSVIRKLGKLLEEEYNLQTGLRKKIAFLSQDLESMHSALRKVGVVAPDQLDEQVKLWARDVRDLSYDADDILDTFLISIEGREDRDPNRFTRAAKKISKLFSKSKARHQIGGMIKIINEKAEEMANRRVRYKVDEIVGMPAAISIVDPRLEAMYKEVTHLVGIEESSGELTSKLSGSQLDDVSNKKMKIVSVVGIGGLGKTTLAKAVYDKLKLQFDCWAFVPIGRNRDSKEVYIDILIDLDKGKYMDLKYRALNEMQLIDELREFLGSKRYLIVIDDVWETKSWDAIKLAFAENYSGSRIITTTRKLDVAKQADDVYKLQSLPCDKSKKLFYTRIFGAEGECPDHQQDEVDKILKKCDGVPLAIITMASLLVDKPREQWVEVCNSIAFRDKDNKQVNETEWILSLSYYDLPPHLKTCLLYLSAFPEDNVIDKYSLIWKWVAEGFVNNKPGTRLFEVGEGYFNELINRSMIIAVESASYGMVDGCRIHDMVLDLLRVKLHEENFLTISNTNAEGTSSPSIVRRLAHQKSLMEQIHQNSQMDLRYVRTFIACRCAIVDTGLSFFSIKLLRVLALEDCSGRGRNPIHLKHLENLLHLRYLGLRRSYICELPKGIGALNLMQTLDCNYTRIRKLPTSIGLLTQLTCLRAGDAMVPSEVMGKLTSLEELQIHAGSDTLGHFVKDLGKLRELRVLKAMFHLNDNSMQSDLTESLSSLHRIRHLELNWWIPHPDKALWDTAVRSPHLRCLIVPHVLFSVLPLWINTSDLPNLSHMDLHVYNLDEEGLKILGGLPQLRHLRLITYSTVTVTFHAADNGLFLKLRSLLLPDSVIRFVLNEDTSISFTLWSRRDGTAFGSETRYQCKVALPTILPNLDVLDFMVHVEALIRNKGSCDNLGLEYLLSLHKIKVRFSCWGAFTDDVEKEEAALRHSIEVHPNQPTLQVDHFFFKDEMKRQTPHDDLLTEEHEDVGSLTSEDNVNDEIDPSTSYISH